MNHECKIQYNTRINIINLKKKKFYNNFLKEKFSNQAYKQNIKKINFYNKNNLFNQILINDNYYLECNFNLIKNLAEKKRNLKIFYRGKVVAVYIKRRIKFDQISNLFKSKSELVSSSKIQINCIDLSKYKTKKIINKKIIKRKALFIDRDGTINKDKGYTYRFNKDEIIPKTLKYMKEYSFKNNIIIIITNQSGIAKKKFKLNDFKIYIKKLKEYLLKNNIVINKVYFCPHHIEGYGLYKKNCEYRKPKIGMIKKGIKYFNLDKKNCEYIGNTDIDKLCAYNAKVIYKDIHEI